MCTPFVIILECSFNVIVKDKYLSPIDNKSALCMLNEFEDGKWRIDSFLEYIWDNIAETALTASERAALMNRPQTKLSRAAKKLRISDNDTAGGEIAEILLYAIMKDYYKALPVVPKIFYKQNVNDYAKGADSVHIVLENHDEFSLWLGEAKFYNSIDDGRLNEIVESVYNTLSTEKIKKENSIILGLNELREMNLSDSVLSKICDLLNGDRSIDKLKPLLHIPILIVHECSITSSAIELSESYKSEIRKFYIDRINSYFKKQIKKCAEDVYLYSSIRFHLVIIPVPEKSVIVKRFMGIANAHKGI